MTQAVGRPASCWRIAAECTQQSVPGRSVACRCDEQAERIDLEPQGDPLHCPEGQIPFAPFEPADIGAVPTQEVSKRLLGETFAPPVPPKVVTDNHLEIPFGHPGNRAGVLLDDLHTYK
jgi:hypothetical protein